MVALIGTIIPGLAWGAGQLSWSRTYETEPSLVAPAREGYYLAGKSSTRLHGTGTESVDRKRLLLIKLDDSGKREWEKPIVEYDKHHSQKSIDEDLWKIISPRDGGCLVVGQHKDKDWGSDEKTDVWLKKFDRAGGMQWSTSFDYGVFDHPGDVVETGDGCIIVGQSLSEEKEYSDYVHDDLLRERLDDLGLDDQLRESLVDFLRMRLYDLWRVRLDPDGNEVSRETFSGRWSNIDHMALKPDGSFIAVEYEPNSDMGTIISFLRDYQGSRGLGFNAQGEQVWEKQWDFDVQDVEACPEGGWMIAGYWFFSNHTWAVVMKVDEQGGTVWRRNFGGLFPERALNVEPAASEGSFLTRGRFVHFIFPIPVQFNFHRLGLHGWPRWGRTYYYFFPYSAYTISEIAPTADGGCIVVVSRKKLRELNDLYMVQKLDAYGRCQGEGCPWWQHF